MKNLLNVISGDVVGIVSCHHGLHLHQVLLHFSLYIIRTTTTMDRWMMCMYFSLQKPNKFEGGNVVQSRAEDRKHLFLCKIVECKRKENNNTHNTTPSYGSGFLCVPTFFSSLGYCNDATTRKNKIY